MSGIFYSTSTMSEYASMMLRDLYLRERM